MSSSYQAPISFEKRMPGLDFLRAVAALWVFVFHFMELSPQALKPAIDSFYVIVGWNGVDLFFVLSGFLIGSILSRDNESIKSFVIRRFFRIYPAYFLVLILCIFVNKPYFIENKLLIVSHVFLFNNLIPEYAGAVNGVLWTLGAEFQFYLLAALILLVPRWRFSWLSLVFFMIFVSLLYRYFVFAYAEPTQRFFLSTQLPGMLVLFGLGFFVVQLKKYMGLFISRYFVLFLALAVAALFLYFNWLRPHIGDYWTNESSMIYGRLFSGVAFSVMVLVFSCAPDWFGSLLKRTGMVFVGEISYGVYLTHLFWFDVVAPYSTFFMKFDWVIYASVLLGLTIASSCLIYFFIERPFIKIGARLASKYRASQGDGAVSESFGTAQSLKT